jgi:hypothetical protein
VVHAKYKELVHMDFTDFSSVADQLRAYEACLFCLGTTSAGKSEAVYTAITYDITLAAARAMAHPGMRFVYVTGQGCDSSERGKTMWARVKGRTENELLRLPFAAGYMFRPGAILPAKGIKSKTKVYQVFYDLGRPLFVLLARLFPKVIITTPQLGAAFLRAAKGDVPASIGTPGHNGQLSAILEVADILALARE